METKADLVQPSETIATPCTIAKERLAAVLRCQQPDLDDNQMIVLLGESISLSGLAVALKELDGLPDVSADKILTERSLEHVVDDSRRIPDRYRTEKIVAAENNAEKYRIGGASDVFLLNSLVHLEEAEFLEVVERVSRGRIFWSRPQALEGDKIEEQSYGWSEVVRHAVSSPQTVTVVTDSPTSKTRLDGLFESFIFHFSYNSGRPLLPRNNSLRSARSGRARLRRGSMHDLDVPRRAYVPELVYHYQLGLSSESPVLAFLSFYHVLEHWYENVFLQDMTVTLRDLITNPRFSFKRNDDLKKLIREVTRQAQIRNDEMVFSEQKALELTLSQYVDLSDLAAALDLIDPWLKSYISTTKVPFSDGRVVNLDSADLNKEYRALADRIYQTRNSLVHSKDNGKKRFRPFKNDRDLVPEARLLQAVSEQVIINSASSK